MVVVVIAYCGGGAFGGTGCCGGRWEGRIVISSIGVGVGWRGSWCCASGDCGGGGGCFWYVLMLLTRFFMCDGADGVLNVGSGGGGCGGGALYVGVGGRGARSCSCGGGRRIASGDGGSSWIV